MPDRPLTRRTRTTAGAALLASILVHIGLLALVLWLVPDRVREKASPLAISELVVIVGDDDPRQAHAGRDDVTIHQIERPAPAEIAPAPSIREAHVVDDPLPSAPVVQQSSATPAGLEPERATGSSGSEGSGPSFFQVSATGRTVIYVLDRSMSMGIHDGLRQARAELLASLSRLPPTTLFQIIAYNQIAEPLAVHQFGGWLSVDADTLAEVARTVAGLRATGRTDHRQALIRALGFRPEVLFLATDADELSAEDVASVSAYNGGRCSIHVIDFSPRPPDRENRLRTLAEQNRGTYRRVAVKEL